MYNYNLILNGPTLWLLLLLSPFANKEAGTGEGQAALPLTEQGSGGCLLASCVTLDTVSLTTSTSFSLKTGL